MKTVEIYNTTDNVQVKTIDTYEFLLPTLSTGPFSGICKTEINYGKINNLINACNIPMTKKNKMDDLVPELITKQFTEGQSMLRKCRKEYKLLINELKKGKKLIATIY